jgi:hypothetical protein
MAVSAEAAVAAGIHKACILSERLSQCKHSIWYIKLHFITVWVIDDGHDRNATIICWLSNKPRSFFDIVCVQLQQMSPWTQDSLNLVVQLTLHVTCSIHAKNVLFLKVEFKYFIF